MERPMPSSWAAWLTVSRSGMIAVVGGTAAPCSSGWWIEGKSGTSSIEALMGGRESSGAIEAAVDSARTSSTRRRDSRVWPGLRQ